MLASKNKNKYYRWHSLRIMLLTFMVGSFIMFMTISGLSLYYVWQFKFTLESFSFPQEFLYSTGLIFLIGFFFYWARTNFSSESIQKLKSQLIVIFVSSLVFLIFQVIGWFKLLAIFDLQAAKHLTGFVYVLSGLHFVHVIGGLGFLAHFIYTLNKSLTDGVQSLLFVSEPYTEVKLKTLSLYWLYLDVIWLLMFAIFYWVYW